MQALFHDKIGYRNTTRYISLVKSAVCLPKSYVYSQNKAMYRTVSEYLLGRSFKCRLQNVAHPRHGFAYSETYLIGPAEKINDVLCWSYSPIVRSIAIHFNDLRHLSAQLPLFARPHVPNQGHPENPAFSSSFSVQSHNSLCTFSSLANTGSVPALPTGS